MQLEFFKKYLFRGRDSFSAITLLSIIAVSFLLLLYSVASQKFLLNLPSTRFNTVNSKVIFNLVFFCGFLLLIFVYYQVLLRYDFFNFLVPNKLFLLVVSAFTFIPAVSDTRQMGSFIEKFYYYFGIGHLHPIFIDLRGFLAGINKVTVAHQSFSVDCLQKDMPCIGWGWSYGTQIIWFRHLPFLRERLTVLLAIVLFLIFTFVITRIAKNQIEKIVIAGMLATGVTLLTVERMNIDIILLPIIYWISTARTKSGKLFSFIFLLLFSITKFYSFILIPFIFLHEKSKAYRAIIAIFTLLVIPSVVKDLSMAGTGSMNFGYAATYGLKNLVGIILGSPEPTFGDNALTLLVIFLILLLVTFTFFNVYLKFATNLTMITQQEKYLFTLCSVNLIFAWSIASNYPYRLVTIFGIIPLIVKLLFNHKFLLSIHIGLIICSMSLLPISLSILRNLLFAFVILSLVAINGMLFSPIYRRVIYSKSN